MTQHISSGVAPVNSQSTSPPLLWSWRGVDTAHLQRSGPCQLQVNFSPPPYEVDLELTQHISSGVASVNSESTSHPPPYEVDTELTQHISSGVAPVNSESTSHPPPYEVDTELTQHISSGVALVNSESTSPPPPYEVDTELTHYIHLSETMLSGALFRATNAFLYFY